MKPRAELHDPHHKRVFFALVAAATVSMAPELGAASNSVELARQILADKDLETVHRMSRTLLKSGLNAGTSYGEVWIRDLNTFIEVSARVNDPARLKESLLVFFKFQGPQGDIVDGYIPRDRANVNYKYRSSVLATNFLAHKNTVETDQESSLVQAIRKYVELTGDGGIVSEIINDRTVRQRLENALNYILQERFDKRHGLVWGATTSDWGDVQPEHEWGVELDGSTHRAIDIYDNAMFLVAIEDYLWIVGGAASEAPRWRQIRNNLRASVRKHLWDPDRRKFIPHLYLAGSPFPDSVDERAIFYHGGTAVAIEAGLLNREEIKVSLDLMRQNVKRAGASSIGLTVYPPYPERTFKNPSMIPYGYQNGGDWCWFGGRMVQQLVRAGYVQDAYLELQPMVQRVIKHGDFFEWWTRDNKPKGAAQFRGSAGVLGRAIEMFYAWAEEQLGSGPTPKP